MSDTLKSGKELVYSAADLLDSEAQQVFEVIIRIQRKYACRANTAHNLEMLRDEVLTRLADIGVLANVDPTPCLHGEPPVVDIVGKVNDPGFKQPFDHAQKEWEVKKAAKRSEDYLGQKERANARKPKSE